MSALLVIDYHRRLPELLQYGGGADEDSIREAFGRLLFPENRTSDV